MDLAQVTAHYAERRIDEQDSGKTASSQRNRSLVGVCATNISRRNGQADYRIACGVIED
jgi:hypothetical protein